MATRRRSGGLIRPTSIDVLRWLRGQAKADKGEARALGTSQAALARSLGVSDRALRHWMAPRGSKDYRAMPDAVAGRLARLLGERLDSLRLRREVQDDAERLAGYRPPKLPLPFKQTRYRRPKFTGEESEIFYVDVHGLSLSELPWVLEYYWHQLKMSGRHWDVRVQARVKVADYFRGGVEDRQIGKSVRGRAYMSIWIPNRLRGLFVHPTMTKSPEDSIPDFMQSLEEYGDRILPDGIQKIAFIPFRTPELQRKYKRKRSRKPSGKR